MRSSDIRDQHQNVPKTTNAASKGFLYKVQYDYICNMNWREHIVSDSNILLGKPVIKGTRISIELILDLLSNGWTEKMILDSYPSLTENDLKAVFSYLREGLDNERFLSFSEHA